MRNLTLRDPAFLGATLQYLVNTPIANFQFAANRTLTDTVSNSNLITFSRAGATATFVNSLGILQLAAANAARFDTNPATLESLGLLVEDPNQNLLLQSENFTTSWARTNIRPFGSGSIADAIAGPDGNITADLLTETSDSTSVIHNLAQQASVTLGQQYSASVFAKLAPGTARRLLVLFSGNFTVAPAATFNLSTGAITGIASGASAAIVAYQNGFYRCIVSSPAAIGSGNTNFQFRLDNGSASTYTGDGSSGLHLWGAMASLAIPSSYVPTGASAVTRDADLADITNANAALVNAIRTIFIEFRSPAIGTRGVISLNDGTSGNRIDIRTTGTTAQVLVVTGGITQATLSVGTVTANTRARLAVCLASGRVAASLNGGATVSATATRPSVDRVAIGRTQAGEYLNGTIAALTPWAVEFTDSMLSAQST